MQKCILENGFALHNITGNYSGKCSAWYDKEGKMLDCEQVLPKTFICRGIKKNGPMWNYLASIGKAQVKT